MRAREYFWFALVLLVLLIGSAARAGTSSDGAPSANKPPIEELEQRIEQLARELEA